MVINLKPAVYWYIVISAFFCSAVFSNPGADDLSQLSEDEKQLLAEDRAVEIVSELLFPGMTEFEKALVLHEYITGKLIYGMFEGETSSYTALIHGQADCVGFAHGLTMLYRTAGLEAFAVWRFKGHLWVRVMIDGYYYNVDPTWCNLKSGWSQFGWFLLSDDQNMDDGKGISHVLDSGEEYIPAPEPFRFGDEYFPHRDRLQREDVIRIIGTVSLPDGYAAPPGGIIGNVNGSRFKISEGESSSFFITSVSRDKDNPYIKYNITPESAVESYAREGVWDGSGSIIGRHNALIIDSDSPDLTGVDLTILPRENFLSGTIQFPPGSVSPPGGGYISMELTAYRETKERVRYYDWIYIPEGDTSADFHIDISREDSELRFYLYYYSGSLSGKGYEKVGYYSRSGTTASLADKDYFTVTLGEPHLILNLLPAQER